MENHNGLWGSLMLNRERQRQDIAQKSRTALSKLSPACDQVLNVCVSLIGRASQSPFESGNPLSHSMFLAAQFLQGVDITRMCIQIGAYHQTANLLKQESEILAAMHEVRSGTRKDRKTAKFRGEMQKLFRKYRELNNIAHPTNTDVVELLASKVEGDNVDPTLDIQFNEALCKNFFGYHSLLVCMFSNELTEVMVNTVDVDVTDEEAALIINAINELVSENAFNLAT